MMEFVGDEVYIDNEFEGIEEEDFYENNDSGLW
jgi:hypothetical protein